MKQIRIGLFGKILIAIALGVLLGYVLPHWGVRILKTFNVFFAQLLKFIVPLLILGLVTPAISGVGRGAGKMLLTVMLLSYFSTVLAAFFAWGCSSELLPHYIQAGIEAEKNEVVKFLPYFELKIPPICDVLTALALSFMVGTGIIVTKSAILKQVTDDFGEIVKLTIMKVIIPGLPIYIMTMICELTASGKIGAMAGIMFKVIGTGWALTIVFLVLLYIVAGIVAGCNPFVTLWRMLPAYLTGLSIASSSAVIPVTLECCEKNGISKDVRDFTIPLCANVHMVGSAIKMLASMVAIFIIYGIQPDCGKVVNFIFMMGIAAVAAPGVMSGVLMASVGLMESIIGLTTEQIGLLMTFYMALDGYGPAANVTGDGAIALLIDRFFARSKSTI
ncbi:MAG: cation:dicarboxylase symporter family transporter [Kiritimatiellae bacterium]|nr:cation:dicarboxylase symporter family transporter [Kiritimatiellia bacterium]